MRTSWNAPAIRAVKTTDGTSAQPLVMVTAYDAPGAEMAHAAGVDLILVGDSAGHGRPRLRRHAAGHRRRHRPPHRRGRPGPQSSTAEARRPMVVADLPWMSYHTDAHEAVRNAAALIRAGAHSVKLEGGRKRLPVIEAILDAEIPVMGHIGLTPQSVHAMGGFKVQGKQHDAALALVADAKALAAAGCFAIVLEGVPDAVARMVTDAVDVPTIGIGAGRRLRRPGARVPRRPRHRGPHGPQVRAPLRRHRRGRRSRRCAAFAADVRAGAFPNDDESYHLSADAAETLGLYGS